MPAKEHILFSVSKRRTVKDTPRIKLLADEKLVSVQRKHWLVIVISLLPHVLFIILIAGVMFFLIYLKYPSSMIIMSVDISIVLLSYMATVGTYLVMDWYYNYYMITDKRIINEHYFHLLGRYYEEVFLEDNLESVDRVEKNIFYDFFKVEDIYIHFVHTERTEPFIFISPENAPEIEQLIEKYALSQRRKKKS